MSLKVTRILGGAAILALLFTGTTSLAKAAPVLFWSNQGTPVQEAQAMRDQVLKGFPDGADFQPNDPAPYTTRIEAELKAGKGTIGLLGGLHGDFASYTDNLVDLSDVVASLGGIKINQTYLGLAKLGTKEIKYIPWMQATYVMIANKQALPYLPAGADINKLTYDQLIAWAKNMAEKTGSPKFGLPAGSRGLINRFVQGFLYPSYTNSMVTNFRSPEAVAMWTKMRELWSYTNPASANYGFMQEPLLTGEVWVAWDHQARLTDAFNQKPNDFVAFPVPAGPTGRGFMPVVAGLAIPKTSPDVAAAKKLLTYMMQPSTQVLTLKALSFFPVVEASLPADIPNAAKVEGDAIGMQTASSDANPGLLPIGLGTLGGKFNQVYIDTFQRILLNKQDIKQVLDQQADVLRSVMVEAKAPCWAPDKPSDGPCPVN